MQKKQGSHLHRQQVSTASKKNSVFPTMPHQCSQSTGLVGISGGELNLVRSLFPRIWLLRFSSVRESVELVESREWTSLLIKANTTSNKLQKFEAVSN